MFKHHRPASSSVSAAPAKSDNGTISLHPYLLHALVTPLFGLIVGTGVPSYWLAAHYIVQVLDRVLVRVVNTLTEQLRTASPHVSAARLYDVALTAQTLIQNSGEDRICWCISNPTDTLVGRSTPLGYGLGQARIGSARVLYSWIDGKQVRAVRLPVPSVNAEVSKPRLP